jgi:hypothetical protein
MPARHRWGKLNQLIDERSETSPEEVEEAAVGVVVLELDLRMAPLLDEKWDLKSKDVGFSRSLLHTEE